MADLININENRTVIVPDRYGKLTEVVIPWYIPSPEVDAERKRILGGQYFLIRQGSLGEVMRCSRCKSKHTHLTLMCVEQPFSGLTDGLYAYFQTAGKFGAEAFMTEAEFTRYEAMREVLMGGKVPDLASRHPMMASTFSSGEEDFNLGSVALGLAEPITKAKAKALAWNINARGIKPPFKLEGIEDA